MPLIDQLFAGGLKGLFDSVVGQFHLSKEDQAKFQAAIDENKKEIELAQIEAEAKLRDASSAEIKSALDAYKAEQTGDDKYTKRWRPTFGYMVTALLFWNFAIVPLLGRMPVVIPDRILEMFGALLLVAIGGRTFEKIFSPSAGNGSGSGK